MTPGATVALRQSVTKEYTLRPGEVRHFADMTSEIIGPFRGTLGDLHGMRFDVVVTGGEGAVVPYVLSTENATGDAILRIE